jgi:hypothetical protein
MSELREAVRELLGRHGADSGCDDSGEVLDQWIEAELAGLAAAELFPDVAVHLASCPDCREDYEGLRELVRSSGAGGDVDGAQAP